MVTKPVALTRKAAESILPPLAVGAIIIAFWYLTSAYLLTDGQQFLLPTPHEVANKGLFEWSNLKVLLEGLLMTTKVALFGLFLAIVFGMIAAVIMSQASWVERTMFPYAIALQAIPVIAIVPVVGLWMGFSFSARVLVTVIISIFPIITNTLFGIKSVSRLHHDLLTLHHVSRPTRFWRLELPSALPAIFTGFRISAGLAVVGALVGEFFFRAGNTQGLGRLLSVYQNRLQMELLIAAIFFSCLLGVAFFALFGALNKKATGAWAPGQNR